MRSHDGSVRAVEGRGRSGTWVLALVGAVWLAGAAAVGSSSGEDSVIDRTPAQETGYPRYIDDTNGHRRVEYSAGLVSVNDVCPPCGRSLSLKMPPVYVNGRPVGFCCSPCPPQFRESPETQLDALGIRMPCAVDPTRDAVLRPDHRSFVNDEIVFFASAASKEVFDAAPHHHGIMLTDPVSGERFRPTDASPRGTHEGRTMYFASDESARRFRTPEEARTEVAPWHRR